MQLSPRAMLEMQIEWGADEAIAGAPIDRRLPPPSIHAAPIPPARLIRPAPSPATVARTPAERARAAADACDSLEALHQALAEGELVPELATLRDTASNLVRAEGDPTARLLLVGELPGAEEDRAGRPFVGPAGQLLDRMLAAINLDRTKLMLTMLVPWRPPGGQTPGEAVIAACLPYLQRQIALLRPNHLILFGNLALRTINGNTAGLRRARGKWCDTVVPGLSAPVPTLPMLAPSLLLDQPKCKVEAWADLLTLAERLGIEVKPRRARPQEPSV